MKRTLFLLTLSGLLFSCGKGDKKPVTVGDVFIQSLKENKFELLEPLMATKEVYKAVASNKEAAESFIDSFLTKNKERLKEEWNKVAETVKEKSIDFSKLKIKDWLVYNPFKDENKDVKGAILVYEYEGKTYDDLTFLVGTLNEKTYLLQVPNPTNMFKMSDTTLQNLGFAKLYMELSDTAFKQKIQARVQELIGYAKENKTELLTSNAVYSGEDETRRWKSAMNPSDVKEFERGSELVQQINNIMSSCTETAVFDSFNYERESEGVWLVQKMKCGNKNIFFAFLKIGDKLLLGEVNADELGE